MTRSNVALLYHTHSYVESASAHSLMVAALFPTTNNDAIRPGLFELTGQRGIFKVGAAIGLIVKMTRSEESIRRWIVLGLVALCLARASATTVISPSFEEMTDRAELIFIGKVMSSRAEWRTVANHRVILTLVQFERQDVLKGEAQPAVTLEFLGGTVGDLTLEVAEVPKFNVGDRELLFVAGNRVQFCPLVGAYHGKFGVRTEEKSGRDVLVLHNGKELRDVAEIGNEQDGELSRKRLKVSSVAIREPLSVDDFKAKIRARVARAGQGDRAK